jgi:hypothetical protein
MTPLVTLIVRVAPSSRGPSGVPSELPSGSILVCLRAAVKYAVRSTVKIVSGQTSGDQRPVPFLPSKYPPAHVVT